jgi:hypothetical protein
MAGELRCEPHHDGLVTALWSLCFVTITSMCLTDHFEDVPAAITAYGAAVFLMKR